MLAQNPCAGTRFSVHIYSSVSVQVVKRPYKHSSASDGKTHACFTPDAKKTSDRPW